MGKTFQAAQLTHERFLTIDHSCKIFFLISAKLNFHGPLVCITICYLYSTTHQRLVEVQFGRYQKNILQEWSMVKNLSCVSCAAWNVFTINSQLLINWSYAVFMLNWCFIDPKTAQLEALLYIKRLLRAGTVKNSSHTQYVHYYQ